MTFSSPLGGVRYLIANPLTYLFSSSVHVVTIKTFILGNFIGTRTHIFSFPRTETKDYINKYLAIPVYLSFFTYQCVGVPGNKSDVGRNIREFPVGT